MINRRGFLGVLATGLVGTCVAAKIPTAWVPAPLRRHAAITFLRTQFNAWCAQHHRVPDELWLGPQLYAAYRTEVVANMRMIPYGGLDDQEIAGTDRAWREYLLFKGVRAYRVETYPTWALALVSRGPDRLDITVTRPESPRWRAA